LDYTLLGSTGIDALRVEHGYTPGPACTGIVQAGEVKLSDFSGIYWSYLLNWIDFNLEIGDDRRLVGGIKTSNAKYLNLLYFFGKRS